MNTALCRRIASLEAKNPPEKPEVAQTDYGALRAMLEKHRKRHQAPKPSGIEGIRHNRDEIARTRLKAEETHTPDHDNPWRTDFRALRIFAAKKDCERNNASTRHEMRRCEMEVLAAEGFDVVRLAMWRAEHDRFADIPWQWRGADLPEDALAVIEAALASANSEEMQR